MKNTTINNERVQAATINITLPGGVYADLERIALFNNITVEELAYSYIVDSVTNDSRIAKRVEFEEHLDENLHKTRVGKKVREEILNDSELLY